MGRKIDEDKFREFERRYYPLIKRKEVSKKEVAKLFGVSRVTINDWCKRIEMESEVVEDTVEEHSGEEMVEHGEEGISDKEVIEDEGSEPFDVILMKTKKDEDDEIEEEEIIKETTKKDKPKSILDEAREIKKKTRKAGSKAMVKTVKEEKDINYNFPRKATFEALDRSYAVMIRAYAERQEWLSKVIEDLGMTALMMALQLAKIPPSEWYDKISEFKDPKAFIDFVNEYIVALFEAKEDASKILELRDENNMLAARVYYLEAQVETLTKKLRELYNYLNAATSLLTKEQLQRLILWNAIYQMQNAEVNKIERGYEINGDEEANGRERFE